MTFAQLCDDFQCVSSPAVERTAKRLAKDIHDMREDTRTLSCFANDSKYSDSIRSFTGRDKYRRLSWIRSALQNPSVHMLGMAMESTSVLEITWQLRGYLTVPGGLLDARVTSTFTLNQISGQVTGPPRPMGRRQLSAAHPAGVLGVAARVGDVRGD
ncbi:hypothetical protein CLOM_g11091 [Closterium sp. NIES-68]|nr:hypothetical protein CLOM_g11091 [Closterium sp. NIES-68]